METREAGRRDETEEGAIVEEEDFETRLDVVTEERAEGDEAGADEEDEEADNETEPAAAERLGLLLDASGVELVMVAEWRG